MDTHKSDILPLRSGENQFPENTKPLENQVAGHSFGDGCFSIGMLKDDEGYVLKPVNKPEQGRKEILFYETVNNSMDDEVVQLKQFLPGYFGSVTLTINGRSEQFLKLTDATRGYLKPCVMDVKMGRQTWEPGVSLEKREREEAKYALCKQQCGFCIPGFQVYNIFNGKTEKFGKDYGKKLTKENIPEVLRKFLNCGSCGSRTVGEEMLLQLKGILSWFRSQRSFHIYSSSVLLTYDAETLRTKSESHCCVVTDSPEQKLTSCVRVFLIDFAHVLSANNTLDLNYLNGLERFVEIFTLVVNEL